ncbi:MAG: U32 family peptidase [Acetobacter sp.]|nr:U32 family peptidase [Bacteroides sp.]MCM1340308.1 U32 family peptidase [Acetobacter sp.]MCM1433045.1 U32 family peptidase [Clostridiales bacterium]
MNLEILAPAGSMESLIAGVRSGANAVYLGGRLFNARRNAGNFDVHGLTEAVKYCHQRAVKVYLTLNILISDDEMESAYNFVKEALNAGVDAFIVQDIGTAKMIKSCFPSARLHGSTQMSIMTPAGAKKAEELGFSRIVLPREMSREEIAEIRRSTDLELELFVHGALCMCVSGQCYLSSMFGSRSGNRGLCAQPCRLPFTAKGDKKECALSLKDLSLINHIDELDGIASLKIEGRMKRPEYVSASVTAVKKAIDGTLTGNDTIKLRSVFSRSGFTDGYFTGQTGHDMFGTRQKEDVVLAKNVLKEISHSYDNENPLLPIDLSFVCKRGKKAELTASALGKTVTAVGDIPEEAINKPMTEDLLKQRLGKLGGTQFYLNKIEISLDEGLILPASKINELRRTAIEKLTESEEREVPAKAFTPIEAASKGNINYITASFTDASQIPDKHPFRHVFIPLNSTIEDFVDNRAGVVLPRGLFGIESKVKERLEKLKKAGVCKALCGNIGSYTLAEEMGFEVFGDFGLNIYNSLSAEQIDNPILSFELTLEQISKINAKNTGIIIYGNVPLMMTRNCPVKNSIGCYECNKNGRLTDRKNIEFPVICSEYPCVEILNSVPVYMLDRMSEVKADFGHFYFSTESVRDIENIIELYKNRSNPPFPHTRGLYYRGTL